MKYTIIIIMLFLSIPSLRADASERKSKTRQEREAETIKKSNIIMKKIYNDIWKIREYYPELHDFGPQNYSDTLELPKQYQTIKSIRIKSDMSKKKFSIFQNYEFSGSKDTIYICFSDKSKAFGTVTVPFSGVYIRELSLYVLMYANTNNTFLKHDIRNILKRNARVTEEFSY